MSFATHLGSLALILISCPKPCSLIRCYVCSSTTNELCGDEFKLLSINALECEGTCVKIRGSTETNLVKVHRQCWNYEEKHCRTSDYDDMKNADICSCNTNYCNHGGETWRLCSLICIKLSLAVSCVYALGLFGCY